MKKMSKIKLIAVSLSVALLASCAGPAATPAAPAAPPAPPAAVPVPPAPPAPAPPAEGNDAVEVVDGRPSPTPEFLTEWARANIDNYLSYEEILERAMQEGGNLKIYTHSTRTIRTAEAFMERYPFTNVEVHQTNTTAMLEQFVREQGSGLHIADVMQVGDTDGTVWVEFVQQGLLHIYWPYDIVPYLDPAMSSASLALETQFLMWYYNTVYFPDGPPISSWWELTLPEWEGRLLAQHPMTHIGNLAVYTAIVQNHELMAEEYERVFGRPIELSEGAENAGFEFLRRFFANDIIFLTSNTEIQITVGETDDRPLLGFAASSGIRRIDEGLNFNYIHPITPAHAVINPSALYIAEGANNPYTAKLYIRFMTDYHGEGAEIINDAGTWMAREGLSLGDHTPPWEEMVPFDTDFVFIYTNTHRVGDYIRFLTGV